MAKFAQSHKVDPAERLRPAWRELDPAVADALRPALPALGDEVIAAVERAVPEYRAGVEENVRRGVRQALDGFVELVVTGSDARLPERQTYVEFGRGEYRVGRSLDALLRAYRAGAQVAWRGLAEAGERAGLAAGDLYTLAEAIFAYIDEISAASAEGFAREQSLAAGAREARRRRLVDLLVRDPPPTKDSIEAAARDADWRLPDDLAVVAFEAEHPDRIARRLPSGSLVGEADGIPIALVPDADGPGRRRELRRALDGARAAIGNSVPPGTALESARRATLALQLAREGELADSSEHLAALLLLGDPYIAGDLVQRRLAPLETLPEARRERLTETLRAWLDAHGEVRATAETLQVHTQTVRYRLDRLRELLGDALDDPDARLDLTLALRANARGVVVESESAR
jgi:PucR C-terminal helix-turn-helix domain